VGYKGLRNEFYQSLVAFGVENPPQQKLKQWARRFREPLEPKIEGGYPRFANHFRIGCAVELGCTYGGTIARPGSYHIGRFGFLQETPERLLRLQIPARRSCIGLVAAIWKAMQLGYSCMREIDFNAGYRCSNFSLKGKVYFGRLGGNTCQEVAALDAVYATLLQVRVFNANENIRRAEQDANFRRIGLPGDVRRHRFGYEYRSFPSFAESPIQTLLTLTLSKLAVLNTETVANWMFVEGDAKAKILNLLARYKGLDEDARLCHWLLSKYGMPITRESLAAAWGLKREDIKPLISLPPIEMKLEREWVTELVKLLQRKPFEVPSVKPWWKQGEAPGKGFQSHASNAIAKALWELKSGSSMGVHESEGEMCIMGLEFSGGELQNMMRKLNCKIVLAKSSVPTLHIPSDVLKNNRKALCEVLCEKFGFYHRDAKPVEGKSREKKEVKQNILFQ